MKHNIFKYVSNILNMMVIRNIYGGFIFFSILLSLYYAAALGSSASLKANDLEPVPESWEAEQMHSDGDSPPAPEAMSVDVLPVRPSLCCHHFHIIQ